MRTGHTHDQRVTVGRGLRDDVGTDVSAGAGAVVDDHGLAPFFAHFGGNQARCRIGGTARREGHDDAYAPARIVVGLRRCGKGKAGAERSSQQFDWVHHGFSVE